jgi:hypothetical protein
MHFMPPAENNKTSRSGEVQIVYKVKTTRASDGSEEQGAQPY